MTDNKRNYLLLASLILIWGSSFVLTDRSLLFFSPEQVVTYRLTIGALSMLLISLIYRKRLFVSIRPWFHFSFYAVIGNILPYLLISTGQMSITSGMAGLLMAVMPLVTLLLAHFFLPNDKLNVYKILGFILGISGVLFILAPSINNGSNSTFGILLVLAAACSYSVNTIVAARLTSYDPIVSSTCVLILASLISFLIWPESLSIAFNEIPLISLSSIILLGVLPTGIAAYIYFIIINSAGATFLANINYLIPVVAFFLGAILLGEEILIQNIIALIFIISGIFISRKNS
jgi:drug/metabolite transporter (DMT)-like permease